MARPKAEDLLAVAHIVRPHGVRGEVSAVVLAPPALAPVELIVRRLYLRSPDGAVREGEGLSVREHKGRWLILFDGIETMDDAEALRGLDVCLTRAELPALPEGWFWEEDLQRCRVIDAALGEIGTVQGLKIGAAQPQLELRRPDGTIVLIPWVKAFIKEVNFDELIIRTDLPLDYPGLASNTEET